MTVQAPLLSCLYWENYCYTHAPYVPYMPDNAHAGHYPHTAVDNTLVIRMVCARSDGVLSGSRVTRTTTTAIPHAELVFQLLPLSISLT